MKQENENINEIIEHLVTNFDQYISQAHDRHKINSLFHEFEDKARNDLMSLIKLSNSRYKGVKSGNSLQSVLVKQSPFYSQIASEALSDQFYKSNEIFQEKKKFRKMNSKLKNIKINNLRDKIKENTKALNAEDIGNPYEQGGKYKDVNMKFYKKLSEVKSPTVEEINRKEYRRKVNLLTNNSKEKSNGHTENSYLINNEDEEVNQNDPRKIFSELIDDDKIKLDKQLSLYQTHLEHLRGTTEDTTENLKSPKKFTFLTDDLKILSYKQVANNNIVEKKDKNDKVEIKNLIKYTKKAAMKVNDLKRNSISKITSDLKKCKENFQELSLNKIEKGNTIQFVKNEIINAMNFDEIIQQKQIALKEYLKDFDLPKMEDYDKIMLRNLTTQKISQFTQISPKIKEESKEEKETKDLTDILQEKYENKQVQWKLEDLQQQNLEKLEKERKKETKLFLNQIKKRNRFTQNFVDPYSIRDEKTNKNILDVNKILGKKFHDKKKLNKKIDEFILNMEFKENEEKEKIRLSHVKPKLSPNEQINKILRENLETEEDFELNFGNRENEIAGALANSTNKNEREIKDQNFKDFQIFKNKIINKEKTDLIKKYIIENKIEKSENFGGIINEAMRRNSTNLLSKSTEQIIANLRRGSMSLKNINTNAFKKGIKSEFPIFEMENSNNPVKKTNARNNTNIKHLSKKVNKDDYGSSNSSSMDD